MLAAKLDYLIHYSVEGKKFVNVYRSMLPWEKWCDIEEDKHGSLVLIEGLSIGDGTEEKFSEKNILIVSDYTEAEEESRRLKNEF